MPGARSAWRVCRWTRRWRWSWSSRSARCRSSAGVAGLVGTGELTTRSTCSAGSSRRLSERADRASDERGTRRRSPAPAAGGECDLAARRRPSGLGDLSAAPARPDGVRGVDGGLPGRRPRTGRRALARTRSGAARCGRPRRRPASFWTPAELRPWAHWITPEFEPRRYDTHFYIGRTAARASRRAICPGRPSEPTGRRRQPRSPPSETA